MELRWRNGKLQFRHPQAAKLHSAEDGWQEVPGDTPTKPRWFLWISAALAAWFVVLAFALGDDVPNDPCSTNGVAFMSAHCK